MALAGHIDDSRPRQTNRTWMVIQFLLAVAATLAISFYGIPAAQKLLGSDSPVIEMIVGPGGTLLAIWLLMRLGGERMADIGLKRPKSWPRTIAWGLFGAAVIFAAVVVSEKYGVQRDLSAFNFLKDNLPLTLAAMVFGFWGAGFYEEVLFRGFALDRFARALGNKPWVFPIAIVFQAALFAFGHGYQGLYGIALTGGLALLMGVIVVYGTKRNLWTVIIIHGAYDAARFLYFHLMLTYFGVEKIGT
jgi:membrane protease YdiL (CAAX protease family)